jgi:hypothetical protein
MLIKFIVLFTLSISAAADDFIITEDNLVKLSKKNNPTLSEIEASFLSSKVQANELQDKFGYEFYAGHSHRSTKEKPIITFMPVFNTVNNYQVGIKKYTKYGIVLDLNRSTGLQSNDTNYSDLTKTTDELGIQVDLWKDFMGQITRSQFDNVNDLKSKDQLQKNISKNVLTVNVRRLYWSLVANQEKIKITQRLNSAAKRQLRDAKKRFANSITDKAQVAQFESAVHQRKGSLLFLKYEREILIKNLRDIFPDLTAKKIELGSYNLSKTIFEVLSCSAQINKLTQAPLDYTQYDEVTQLLKKMQTRQLKVDGSYDDIDLKFDLKLQRVGVASESADGTNYSGNYADSTQDFADNDRSAMSAGLVLTIPFGQDKSKTTTVKETLTEKQFDASISSLDANVKTTHFQVLRSVNILTEVIKEQKANSKALGIRVKEMEKKYAQARIPEYVLIQDQDSLLQSDINIVDTQLKVVNTLLDYLAVFNTFPCSFNRI